MILAFAALLALAQAAEPPPPPEVAQAAAAWSACIGDRLDRAADDGRPEAVADAILGYCRPQQDATMAAHARWIDGSSLSDREKAGARRAAQRSLRDMRPQIIRAIREGRRNR